MKNPFGIVRKCLIQWGLYAIRDKEMRRIVDELTEVQANFLVAAINNHENLVGACEKALEIIKVIISNDPTNEKKMWVVDVENTLNAALAATKEKQ